MKTLALAALAAIIATPVLAAEACPPDAGTLTDFKAGASKHVAEGGDRVGVIDTTEPTAVKALVAEARARTSGVPAYLDDSTEVVIFYNKITGVGMVDYFKGECSLGFFIMPVKPPSQAS